MYTFFSLFRCSIFILMHTIMTWGLFILTESYRYKWSDIPQSLSRSNVKDKHMVGSKCSIKFDMPSFEYIPRSYYILCPIDYTVPHASKNSTHLLVGCALHHAELNHALACKYNYFSFPTPNFNITNIFMFLSTCRYIHEHSCCECNLF